ncbi:hypothetical protein ACOR62_06080 [Neisseria lisongii]|uniref:Lipoprotein n=1 Tax=Neisseria lisongii TaxID=2912188 RepID=A0AAW5AHU0_9NEIS|nr:hypothetical protein [Neisseria lisongii]MCF7528804.1 hypothetical protein [Neisseria lisongii]MCF7529662.1 hypothetical protein [Neisseria lisongii]
MKKLFIASVALLLSACGTFPSASEYWTYQGKPVTPKIVVPEMEACGFINTWNPISMDKDSLANAYLCMEKKGFLFAGKKACTWIDSKICK